MWKHRQGETQFIITSTIIDKNHRRPWETYQNPADWVEHDSTIQKSDSWTTKNYLELGSQKRNTFQNKHGHTVILKYVGSKQHPLKSNRHFAVKLHLKRTTKPELFLRNRFKAEGHPKQTRYLFAIFLG